MGARTAGSIITEALLRAGDDSLSLLAIDWLNDWLESSAAGWAWPVLQARAEGIALTAGARSLTIGSGVGGIANGIHRVRSPIFVYSTDYTTSQRAFIKPLTGGPAELDESASNPANTGTPTSFKIRKGAVRGTQVLWFHPVSDKAYVLAVDYQIQPARITSAQTPWYENDRTAVQAVMQRALEHLHGPSSSEAMAALEVLGTNVVDDRIKYGIIEGTNDTIALDPTVFR